MSDRTECALTVHEQNAVDQAFEIFSELEVEQVDRVLAHVQIRLVASRSADKREDRIMFARGIAGPFGKLICAVKTKIDEVTYGLFLQQCVMRGTDASSTLRDCVYALVHGKTYQQMVMEKINHDAQRTEAVTKLIGPFGAPESNGVDTKP